MKAKDIILKAFERKAKGEKGLDVIGPSDDLSSGHIKKADHNLIVMTDLNKLGHEDWVVIAAYYSMYQAALGILAKIGLDSKDHATTVAILEYFFGKQIDKTLLEKFNELKERKDKLESIRLDEKYIDYLWKIKIAREIVQYGISITYKETNVIMGNAREFVSKIKLLLEEIDEELVRIISEKIRELSKS